MSQPVTGGMLSRQHQRPIGTKHAPKLPQRLRPVVDVFQRQRKQHKIH